MKSYTAPGVTAATETKSEKAPINTFKFQTQPTQTAASAPQKATDTDTTKATSESKTFNFPTTDIQKTSSASGFNFPTTNTSSAPIVNTTNNASSTAPSIQFPFNGGNNFGNFGTSNAGTATTGLSNTFSFAPTILSTKPGAFQFTSNLTSVSSTTPNAFGSAGTAGAGIGGGDEDEDGGDDEGGFPIEEPEKILRNEADKSEIMYEVKCKLFRFNKTDKEWKDAGGGNMRIIKDAESNKQQLLVRNDMGKITLNCNFYKGMKFDRLGKNGIKFLAVVDESNELKMIMIKVNIEQLENAISKLNAAVASV
jgi:hypothetical protein